MEESWDQEVETEQAPINYDKEQINHEDYVGQDSVSNQRTQGDEGEDDNAVLAQDGGEDNEEEEDILDSYGEAYNARMLDQEETLLMRFCPHDSSMLYPKECKGTRSLLFACRLCQYSEQANCSIIFKNVLKPELGNVLTKVPAAVSDDPTLPRSQKASCENCGHNEAVFFQSDTSDVRNDTLALIFVCCNCDYKWVT